MPTILWSGGLDKGFEALRVKDYYGAKKQFEKLRYKEPIGSFYGLSRVHYERQNPFYDIDQALAFCLKADSMYAYVGDKEHERLSAIGVGRKKVLALKDLISERAFEDLRADFTEEKLANYIEKYRYSKSYINAVNLRDSIAFEKASLENSYVAYRNFITEYPGAQQRAKADSLYALKFFEEKTMEGSVEDYKVFVKEFPVNPYSTQAYDAIFEHVEEIGTSEAYYDYITEFPENSHTAEAWLAINRMELSNFQETNLAKLISNYPTNPMRQSLEKELELFSSKTFVMQVKGGEQLINQKGVSLGEIYDEIDEFNQGLARVVKQGEIGYINRTGNLVIDTQYSDGFGFYEGVAVVEKESGYGAIDRFGAELVSFSYLELGNLKSGYMAFKTASDCGYLKATGEKEISGYEFVSDFAGQKAVVRENGSYGAIDLKGEFSVPTIFDWVEEDVNGFSRVKQGDKYGLYKHYLGLVVPVEYDVIGLDVEGLRMVSKVGKIGYVDSQGEFMIPLGYDYDSRFPDKFDFAGEYAAVLMNGKWGLIDRSGTVVIEPSYELINNSGYEIIPAKKRNKWGFISIDQPEFGFKYDSAEPFFQGMSVVSEEGKYGLVDMLGTEVIEPIYLELELLDNSEYAIFEADTGNGVVSRKGIVLLEPVYDAVTAINLRYLKLTLHGKDQVYDLDSQVVVWSAK